MQYIAGCLQYTRAHYPGYVVLLVRLEVLSVIVTAVNDTAWYVFLGL